MRIGQKSLKQIGQIILMFMFYFDVSLIALPSLFSTRKIAFVILVLILMRKISLSSNVFNVWSSLFMINIVLFLYTILISLLQNTVGNDCSIIPRYTFFIIYTLLGSVLLVNYFQDVYSFADITIKVMWIQSVFVIAEFFLMPLKKFMNVYVVATGNVDYLRVDRGTGLGAEAAYLTLMLFLGVFCCNYFIINNRPKLLYIISQAVFLAAMILVGKTGILISLLCIAYTIMIILPKKGKFITAIKVFAVIIVCVLIGIIVLKRYMSEEQFIRQFYKLYNTFINFFGNESVQEFSTFIIPPITLETIIGTGIYRGYTSSGLYLWNDSGYIQMYSALGLISSIIFYVILYRAIYKLIRLCKGLREKSNVWFMKLYFLILVIVEVKEPFIFKYMLPMFAIVMSALIYKNSTISE